MYIHATLTPPSIHPWMPLRISPLVTDIPLIRRSNLRRWQYLLLTPRTLVMVMFTRHLIHLHGRVVATAFKLVA